MKIRLLTILCILLMSLGIQAQTEEFETAAEAVKNMKVGWSYPISLESGPEPGESLSGWQAYETLYGNPLTKPELMKLIRKAGYNAVRLPITWFFHMDSEGNVDIEWMHRIHEIVDYVIDQNMYCIINAHHDTADGWLRADMDIYNQVHKRYEFLWKQISEEFKDYDHHLVFEAYNEMLDNYLSWGQPTDEYGENHIQSSYDALNKYAQSFVNAVRSTGGNNLYRNLVVCTYGAQHRGRSLQELIIPKDEYPDHLIMEVHCYPDFRTVEESKAVVDDLIAEWANAIEQKKCPMLIGEWGPWHRDWITESDYAGFADYFIKKTKEHNIATFDWIGPVCNGQYRIYPAIENTEYVKAVMKAYYGDSYDPIMLTTEDYNDYNKVTFTEKNAELTLLGYGAYDLDHYIGYNLELANDPALNVLQIKAYGNEGEQLFDVYSKSTSVSFDKTKLGTQLLLVTLQNKQSDQYIVSVDRGCILLQGGDIKEEEVRNHWGCDLEFAPSRKQFVHTVEYDGIWTELNLFDDNIPLKLKNYKGIRVEFAEPINVDDFIIKVYADNGAVTEGRAPNSSISTTLLFSDFNVNDVINRVTLQYCKEGKAKTKVVSAWLIRQDGTEEYSDLSPFWGCEIKEKTPYKAAASKEASNVTDQYLVNPSFNSDLHGWTNTGGTAKWKENTWEALNNYCEFEWTGGPVTNQKVVQTITLPAGNYRLSVTCASDPGSSGLYLIAGSYSKEMPGTGGVDSFSLDFIVAKESAITIGMKVENTTATWVNFDNFKLERLESTTDIHGISTTPTKNNTVIYNLWGQKLAKPQKGINIINGKKVLVK